MSRKKTKRTTQPATPEPSTTPALPVAKLALACVLGAYLLLALAVAVIVPYEPSVGGKVVPPDETAHWAFICELAEGKGLPVFTSGGGNYEAHQPPLFYLSALWTRWLGGDSGMYLARVWCALFGGLTLIVAWLATRYLLGDALWPRLAAVGALAFMPGRLFIVGSVSNDALLELLSATTLLIVLRATRVGLTPKGALLLGATLGAALLTKTSAIILIPVVGLGVLLVPDAARTGHQTCPSPLRLLRDAGLVALPVALIWGWWVVRNMTLYGEPLAMQTFERIFAKDRATPELFLSQGRSWGDYWAMVLWQTWMSLWGVFGQATVYMPGAFYSIGSLLAVCGGVGLAARGLRARAARPERAQWIGWGLALLVLALAVASFLRFNTVFYQAQARYLLTASVVLASLLSAGITGISGKAGERPAAIAVVLALAAMSLWAVAAHVTGGYTLRPPGVQ